jgi:hypothetical protein
MVSWHGVVHVYVDDTMPTLWLKKRQSINYYLTRQPNMVNGFLAWCGPRLCRRHYADAVAKEAAKYQLLSHRFPVDVPCELSGRSGLCRLTGEVRSLADLVLLAGTADRRTRRWKVWKEREKRMKMKTRLQWKHDGREITKMDGIEWTARVANGKHCVCYPVNIYYMKLVLHSTMFEGHCH